MKIILAITGLCCLIWQAEAQQVELVAVPAEQRIDVKVDGKLFTAYRYPTTIKKPVLYPLNAASGVEVTRGYPLAPRPGERVDHPHHVGAWFNFGSVNGHDFWNNSNDIGPEHKGPFGSIVHRRVIQQKSGRKTGRLVVEAAWLDKDGQEMLREKTTFLFAGGPNQRSVTRITTLTALDQPVIFRDNKEGLFAIRVARQLEAPADKPEIFTDANGKITPVAVLDNTGVTGIYTNREGLKGTDFLGNQVWGKKSAWMILTGIIGGEPVTVAILDHPQNLNHPAHWQSRGYGLFAINNLGSKVYDPNQPEFSLSLAPCRSLTFKHKVLIYNAVQPGQTIIDREWHTFSK